jgi:ABC-type dipeptide/oligopeptide/nickel transport system permease component
MQLGRKRNRKWAQWISGRLFAMLVLCLLCAAGIHALMRFTPGALQGSTSSLASTSDNYLQQEQTQLLVQQSFFFWLSRLMQDGDAGQSESLRQPVKTLLAERLPATLWRNAAALSLAVCIAMFLAALPLLLPRAALVHPAELGLRFGSLLLLSIPAGVMALLGVAYGAPAMLVLTLLLVAPLFQRIEPLVNQLKRRPFVQAALAQGMGRSRIFFTHVFPHLLPTLAAITSIGVLESIGLAIPVESLCGEAGLGSLLWQAAQSRDLPLLLVLGPLTCGLTLLSTMLRDSLLAEENTKGFAQSGR